AALGGLGVGAADYRDTPAFGQSPPLIEDFSSAGGIPIHFDTAGNRLAPPENRQQPDITAPDGVDTTFFDTDTDGSGFPNFAGTSASAPHAAGIAALITERNPSFGPDNIYSVLKSTAIDMDDPATPGIFDTGFDFGTGHGLVQADAALDLVPPLVELRPAAPRTTCRQVVGCRVRLDCQLTPSTGTLCTNQVGIFVRAGILRRGPDSTVAATRQRLIRFASARASLQPGQTANVRLRLTRRGRQIVRQRNPLRFRARLMVTSMNGASVTNTPIIIRIR
ncbi:MAG: S8 family serine peptidase, partial [bacterium]